MASHSVHKYDNLERFKFECKKYVSEIQNYSGVDHLAPWYAYLLWMEENFVIDFAIKETIFDEVLAACLCQFENDARYKQDRRLIKLFIKFIHFQDEQDTHYEVMVANEIGNKVADLYINWAFHFDVADQFQKADRVFIRGRKAGAEPLDLLKAAHEAFGYSMSQRILHKSDADFQQKHQIQMKQRLEEIASLRIDGKSVKTIKSMALQKFDKTELMGVCLPNSAQVSETTPEQKHNTSVAKPIIDSARKMKRERSEKLIKKACRLDFNDNQREVTKARPATNLYEKGIQFGRHFKKVTKNLPQKQVPPTPYNDPSIGKFRGELPGYDKIMLVPATDFAFSADELKAYKWFKQRRIDNAFTKEQDKIWGVGYNVPIRWANVFARKNVPQPEWIVPRIDPSDALNERGAHRFVCNMVEMYPDNSSEEYSPDEIMWRKWRAINLIAPQQPVNKSVMKSNRLMNRTVSNDSKLSPIVEMELSGYGDVLLEVPQKRESIQPHLTMAERNKKRKSSIYPAFDALNDTCTTQMFSNLLHSTAISTPKIKMPKFDQDESINNHWQDETKLKLFTDQSTELMPDPKTQGDKNDKSQPNDFGFAIYEDKTQTMHAIKNAACKGTIDESSIGNKENIAVNENQLVNLEPTKTSGKLESAVINSSTQPGMKVAKQNADAQQPNAFKFDVYTDTTETMVKVWQNAQKLETSNENKENLIEINTSIQTTKQNTSIAREIENVEKMIESVLNATKHETTKANVAQNHLNATQNIKEESVFKAPLPPKKTESAQRPSDTYFELLDTTEEFEMLEAQCKNSPNINDTSLELSSLNLEQNFAKNMTIAAANKATNKSIRYSIEVTEEERLYVVNNSAICNKTRLNWTQQPSIALPNKSPIIEHEQEERLGKEREKEKEMEANEVEEENEIGKSIYIKQLEPEFNEKDADWKEYTQFLANNTLINDYIVEDINLDETKHRIDTHMLNLKDLNPFDPEVQKDILNDIGFVDQLSGANNFNCVMMNVVPPLKPRSSIEINKEKYQIKKLIGTGAYGKVFLAEGTKSKKMYALKQQRPPNLWEYYVCLQIHERLTDERVRNGFMSVDFAFIGNNATTYASKFSKHGTILNVCNKVKQSTNKPIEECIVMILVKQMFTIMEHFHRAKLIHADVKPDNFLLMDKLSLNYENPEIVLQLIDFGQSIDLNYFSNHVFWAKVKTENFVCTEMMEDKPWTYHCDMFCLASTIYTMVAGKYMVVSRRKPTDPYKPQKLPRYVNATLWNEIFETLINIPSLRTMPSFAKLQRLLDIELKAIGHKKLTESITKFNKALD